MLEIGIDDGISEKDEHFIRILEKLAGGPDGMSGAQPLVLGNKDFVQVRVLLFNKMLDLLAKVSDYKYKITDPDLHHLVDDKGKDRLACHQKQRLRLCIRKRSQPGASPGNWNNGFHNAVLEEEPNIRTEYILYTKNAFKCIKII